MCDATTASPPMKDSETSKKWFLEFRKPETETENCWHSPGYTTTASPASKLHSFRSSSLLAAIIIPHSLSLRPPHWLRSLALCQKLLLGPLLCLICYISFEVSIACCCISLIFCFFFSPPRLPCSFFRVFTV